MTFFTRPDICFCVWEEVVRAEGKEIEFANVLVIEMVSASKPNEEWLVAVFTHELVQLLSDMVHLNQNFFFINN